MFGKRSTTGASPAPPPERAPAPEPQRSSASPVKAAPIAELRPAEPRPGGQVPAKTERKPVERARSEEYYDVKTTVFNALIDTIDLTQLAKLESEAAREEIRDIVSEIVAIKNVVMSIAEQEDLLQDGPLEPLLARDDIADIRVNGAETTYIEVKGKVESTNVRFADNAQLMNICQRIVSQVGRRVDEAWLLAFSAASSSLSPAPRRSCRCWPPLSAGSDCRASSSRA